MSDCQSSVRARVSIALASRLIGVKALLASTTRQKSEDRHISDQATSKQPRDHLDRTVTVARTKM